MLPTIIGICIVVYICLLLIFIVKGNNNSPKKETVIIKAPSEFEIKKEKEYWSKKTEKITYPDKEFELIVRYILDKDPNPRKVVKLIQSGFSETERKMLMLCLNINNPILYNEVLSLQHCDATSFEEYESEIIEVEEKFNAEIVKEKEMQGGIPADFFMSALEYDKDPENVLNNISNAFENLPFTEQEMILKHCEKIRRNKREKIQKSDNKEYSSIMEEADQAAEIFMQLYKENLNRT